MPARYNGKIEVLRCNACGKDENIDLIDTKDDGTGNFTILHCIACYGPYWAPATMCSLSQSIRPDLKALYDAYTTESSK